MPGLVNNNQLVSLQYSTSYYGQEFPQEDYESDDEATTLLKAFEHIENDPMETSFTIQDYNLEEEDRFEVAKICAGIDVEAVSMFIPEYDLTENHRFEIAKLAAPNNSFKLSKYISLYNLKESQRFEIAKNLVLKEPNLAQLVKYYNLTQNHLFDLAKMLAQQDGFALAQCIHLFNLDSEEHRLEIAKISIKEIIRLPSGISRYLKNFDLNENSRFILAKKTVEDHAGFLAFAIEHFNLTKEEDRFEIAKLLIKNKPCTNLWSLDKFHLTDEHEELIWETDKEQTKTE